MSDHGASGFQLVASLPGCDQYVPGALQPLRDLL